MKIRFPIFLLAICVLHWSPGTEAQVQNSLIYASDHDDCVATEPVEVQLSTDTAGITSWWWDLGNGQQSSSQRPLASYDTAGSFDVTLTVDTVRWGPMTIVEEDLVQINQHVFEDDFNNPEQSITNWGQTVEDLMINSALDFEVMVKSREHQQNGEIICLNGGGRNPPLSNGRFYFDLQLIHEDSRFVSYSPFRLLDPNSAPLIGVRIRRDGKDFEIGIEDVPRDSTAWHTLVGDHPVLSVQVDWYHLNGFGEVQILVQEDSEPAFVHQVPLAEQTDIADLQLGIIDIEWPEDGTRHGRMRLDDFRVCEFEHRPSP